MAKKEIVVVINGEEYVSKAAGEADTALGGFTSKIPGWGKAIAVLAVAYQAVSAAVRAAKDFVLDSLAAYDTYAASQRKLEGTAKLTGIALSTLTDVAKTGRESFQLSTVTANEFSAEIGKLTGKAGDITKSKDAMAAFLDIGAARGLSAADTLKAVQQAVLGIDEGTDKLFGKNPSVLYEEYADKVGKSAGKLTDQEKAMALLDATMEGGEKVKGAYLEYLQSAAGQQEIMNNRIDQAKVGFGQALQPVRTLVLQGLNKLLDVLLPVVQWLGEAANAAGVTLVKAFNGMKIAVGDVAYAFGRLTGNKDIQAWGKELSQNGRQAIADVDAMVAKLANATAQKADQAQVSVKTTTRVTADELKEQEKAHKKHMQEIQHWYKLLDDSVVKYKDVLKALQPEVQKAMKTEAIKTHNDALEASKKNADLLIAKMKESATIPQDIHKVRDAVGEVGTRLGGAADEVIRVGKEFGGLDQDAQTVLTSVKNIGDVVGALAKGGLNFAGVAGVLGGVATIVSTMMAGDKERRELTRENTAQIRKLNTDGLKISNKATGQQIAGITNALSSSQIADLARLTTGPGRDVGNQMLVKLLADQGLRLSALDAVASELGMKIRRDNGQIELSQLPLLFQALQQNGGQLTRIGQSFGEQFAWLKEVQRLEGSSGVGAIQGLLDFLTGGSGQVRALQGLDLSNTAAARNQLLTMLGGLNNNVFNPADFGRLTGEEFRSVIVELIGLLDGLKDQAPSPGTPPPTTTTDDVVESTTGVAVSVASVQDVIEAMDQNIIDVLSEHTALQDRIALATEGAWNELQVHTTLLTELVMLTESAAPRLNSRLAEVRAVAMANAGRGPEF